MAKGQRQKSNSPKKKKATNVLLKDLLVWVSAFMLWVQSHLTKSRYNSCQIACFSYWAISNELEAKWSWLLFIKNKDKLPEG